MPESLSDLIVSYISMVKPLDEKNLGGERKAKKRSELGDKILNAIGDALEKGAQQGEVERVSIESFDDWEERNTEIVEFVRGDKIISFKIQSITMNELRDIQRKIKKSLPPEPKPPIDNGRPDYEDRNYKKLVQIYGEAQEQADHLMQLYLIELGWAAANDAIIPGKNDEEKIKALENKIAGDLPELAAAIYAASNLREARIEPFSIGSSRKS